MKLPEIVNTVEISGKVYDFQSLPEEKKTEISLAIQDSMMAIAGYRSLKRENQLFRRVGLEIAHDRRFWVGAAFTLAVLLAVATTLLALTWGGVIVI